MRVIEDFVAPRVEARDGHVMVQFISELDIGKVGEVHVMVMIGANDASIA